MIVFFFFYLMSIILTFSCSDWFLIWVGLEMNMMSFIAMVYDRSSISVEVCLKYFFIQSLGSGILMMLFYSEFIWFEYIMLTVLSYKVGGGPFYFWFPSVCSNLGWGSCFLMMSVQKILPLMIISLLVSMFLWMIIMSSILVGAIGSMNQSKLKRLMAYSSIHHLGWIMVSNFVSKILWMIYLFIYSMMILGIFWILWKDQIFTINMLSNLSNKWSFVLGMVSMGGMPPMLGFYLKWWLFYNLMMVDFSILLFMFIMSVVMFYIYLRIVYMVIMGSKNLISWILVNKNKMILSMDFMYMYGINLGGISWMVMM